MDSDDPVDECGALFQSDLLVSEVRVRDIPLVEKVYVPDTIVSVGPDNLVQQRFDVPLEFLWPFEDVWIRDFGEGVFHDLIEVSHLWSGGCQLKGIWIASFAGFGFERQVVLKLLIFDGVFEVEAELPSGAGQRFVHMEKRY